MRIGIIGVPYLTGGGVLSAALYKFLRDSGHEVIRFDYYYMGPHTQFQRTLRKALGWRLGIKYRANLIAHEFGRLVENIRSTKCEVIIAVEQGEILLHDLGDVKKIFYANAPIAHEVYFQQAQRPSGFKWETYTDTCAKELSYYKAADLVLFCWNTHVEYVKNYVYSGENIILHPGLGWYGCDKQLIRTQYSYPPFLVYTGLTSAYWNNADLLRRLTQQIPYAVHIFSPSPPPGNLAHHYLGMADTLDILCKYQFGIHTSTSDPVRSYGFASKILSYLSYGLPSLAPEWQLMSHQLGGVIPYNEHNFATLVDKYMDPKEWQNLSDLAYRQAMDLEWTKVLHPLLALL